MMRNQCVLILEDIRSVLNTGSLFRTADCLGVSKIYLIGTTPTPIDRFGRKRKDFAKVALGAEDTISWEYRETIFDLIKELRIEGYRICALEQSDTSESLRKAELSEPLALIVGNEVEGVSKESLDSADTIYEIEMKGSKESLNVSVATGIALYALLT